jgi:YVTN family beta-propeller protein
MRRAKQHYCFNLIKNKIIEQIPCGSFPYGIDINKSRGTIVVTNLRSDNITILDCKNRETIMNIRVSNYPTKAAYDQSGKYILVCESNMGIKSYGTLSIFSADSLKLLGRIKVGDSPVDVYSDNNYCYISNLGDGTVSIADISKFKEIKRIKIGGMPRGIIKSGKFLYVGDNYNNLLYELNIEKDMKKVITIGKEPTAMTIY